ncbi:type IV secretion system protein VirB3 [Phenylobacterium sp. Root700]|uniref:type IV secretion system protein VirB3 n=1 Tax=Phenylobacterium sp. Root700 TaxID=1736591 RepID=UPI000701E652|nr:type IV secretion system protein VirB3 [Phenylobacterium sp. Root700]KRB42581.1 type IV secretion system protein VirB3 [Phenylobacterium sp. Root700]
MASERLVEDTLFLACTRPAMVLGVPIEAMGLNIIASGLCFLLGDDLTYLLAAPALHGVSHAICRTDPNAYRLLFAFLNTKGRARNIRLWGGSSPSPLPLRRSRRLNELRHG